MKQRERDERQTCEKEKWEKDKGQDYLICGGSSSSSVEA